MPRIEISSPSDETKTKSDLADNRLSPKDQVVVIESRVIKGKRIDIVDSHHEVLIPWAEVRSTHSRPLNLITLDHHTDTMDSFEKHIHNDVGRGSWSEDTAEIRTMLLQEIDISDSKSVASAVGKLAYDEHIATALKIGIFEYAWVISFSPGGSLFVPECDDRAFAVNDTVGYELGRTYLEEDIVPHYNLALETEYLNAKMDLCKRMSPSPELLKRFILDIDLDYFHTWQSLHPSDPETFFRLVNEAISISIAREPECVTELWRDDNIDHEKILSTLLSLIRSGLSHA